MLLIISDCVAGHINSESNVYRPVSCWAGGAQADSPLRLQIFWGLKDLLQEGERKGGASPGYCNSPQISGKPAIT